MRVCHWKSVLTNIWKEPTIDSLTKLVQGYSKNSHEIVISHENYAVLM